MFVNIIRKQSPMGSHEVQEQESGTYIFPNENEFENSWIMWLWPDGSADIYTKRSKTGAVLGKPIHLPAPKSKSVTMDNLRVRCENLEDFEKLLSPDSGQRFKIVSVGLE